MLVSMLRIGNPHALFWRRQWKPTPVLLLEKSQGQRSLVGYSTWGCKEWDKTERLHFPFLYLIKERSEKCTRLRSNRVTLTLFWLVLSWWFSLQLFMLFFCFFFFFAFNICSLYFKQVSSRIKQLRSCFFI